MDVNNESTSSTNSGANKVGALLSKAWPYLAAILAIVVAIQAWGLVRMHSRLKDQDLSTEERSAATHPRPGSTDPNSLSLWPGDPFDHGLLNSPFDRNTWDPFQEMQAMRDQIDGMFGEAFGRFSQSPLFGDLYDSGDFTPHIDVQDKGDYFVVEVDLPGAERSNVDVSCEDQELRISGSLDHSQELKKDDQAGMLLRKERRSGHFSRNIPLPAPVQADKMETRVDKGVVTITIPKAGL